LDALLVPYLLTRVEVEDEVGLFLRACGEWGVKEARVREARECEGEGRVRTILREKKVLEAKIDKRINQREEKTKEKGLIE
jgi:hypothetical protein